MINPEKVVRPEGFKPKGFSTTDTVGLYRFKDGDVYLVRLHKQSGDWQTMCHATAEERKLIPPDKKSS